MSLIRLFNVTNYLNLRIYLAEMARGSIGRERMLAGVVGISAHQPPASGGHQEDLNNELLAVSLKSLSIHPYQST